MRPLGIILKLNELLFHEFSEEKKNSLIRCERFT